MVLIGAASYGMLSPFIKLAYSGGLNTGQVTAAQVLGGTAVLWLLVAMRYKHWSNPFKGPWIKLSLIGIFALSLTTVLLNEALAKLDASLAIVLLFQFAWVTLLMESILLKKKPQKHQLLAVGLVFIGTFLSVGGIPIDALRTLSFIGVIFGLLSAVTYSSFIVFTGRLRSNMDATLKSAVMLTASLPFLFFIYPPQQLFSSGSSALLFWGLLLGMLGSVIPTVSFNIGIPKIGSSWAAILGSVELPVSLIGALALLGESISWLQWGGMMFIVLSIVISQKKVGEK